MTFIRSDEGIYYNLMYVKEIHERHEQNPDRDDIFITDDGEMHGCMTSEGCTHWYECVTHI